VRNSTVFRAAHFCADDVQKSRTLVFERSMTRCLKSAKLRYSEQLASAAAVTPTRNAVVACVRISLAGAGAKVDVNVNNVRRNIQPGDVHHLQRREGSIFAAAAILPSPDRYVANGTQIVLRIDNMAALKKQVGLRRLSAQAECDKQEQRESCSHISRNIPAGRRARHTRASAPEFQRQIQRWSPANPATRPRSTVIEAFGSI
jgi:hypothetical protein